MFYVPELIDSGLLAPDRHLRVTLIKWLIALLIPIAVFTFVWSGEAIENNVLLGIFSPGTSLFNDVPSVIQGGIFCIVFYATVIALVGYLVAADDGRRGRYGTIELWADMVAYTVIPILLISWTNDLLIGLALAVVLIAIYLFLRRVVRSLLHYSPPLPLADIQGVSDSQRAFFIKKAKIGSFWFATTFAIVWLIVDSIFFLLGSLSITLLICAVVRTLILPLMGYFLGWLGGIVAVRQTIREKSVNGITKIGTSLSRGVSKRQQLESLSMDRAREEAHKFVPSDQPLQSRGVWYFGVLLIAAFVLFYPALDPVFFAFGTNGRLVGYDDLGYYVILALGLNIVVGFAGLLDLGYVAFFVLGTYTWALIGSDQFTVITGIITNPQIWPWLFWPMLIIGAVIAALWGVLLGAPTLRLRGDYLAIVTLGFGEIIPLFFQNLDKYTKGTNGISGIYHPLSPCTSWFPCIDWASYNPVPYYYLILVLIALSIFANVRLRDSRLGRAWIAIREDEIAASSSGINLVKTKLLAFAAGAFFAGVVGVYHAAKLGTVASSDFNSTDSFIYLAMVVIGGLGSIPGVILGAVIVYSLNQLILAQLDSIATNPSSFLYGFKQLFPSFNFTDIRNLLFGLLLITIMLFRPEGLIPSARRRRELHQKAEETVEVGALDELPGTPEFEAEIHVE
jgi:ABC-type branched-subunit amino acid transport system permease subunit